MGKKDFFKRPNNFKEAELNKSAGILDDFSVRKSQQTREAEIQDLNKSGNKLIIHGETELKKRSYDGASIDLTNGNINLTAKALRGDMWIVADELTANLYGAAINADMLTMNATTDIVISTPLVDIGGDVEVTGEVKSTSFRIGANTLNTSEFGYLDGQNQAVKTTSTPTFSKVNNLTLTSQTTGFSIAGGTTSKSIVVSDNSEINQNLKTNSTVASFGRMSLTASTSSTYPGLTIYGNRPNIIYEATGLSGGVAYAFVRANGENTDDERAKLGDFGVLADANAGKIPAEPPATRYLYMDARSDGAYNKATLKIDVNDRVGIAIASTTRPSEALEVNGNVKASGFKTGAATGVSGSFTTADGKTVTVTNGLITAIV